MSAPRLSNDRKVKSSRCETNKFSLLSREIYLGHGPRPFFKLNGINLLVLLLHLIEPTIKRMGSEDEGEVQRKVTFLSCELHKSNLIAKT